MTVNHECRLMSAASENELFSRVTCASPERSSSFTLIGVRSTYLMMAIVTAAMLLRLYGISLYSLEGDEYRSLVEANSVGLNWNSIVYSTMLHFWAQWGSTELWLRLPAAVFGAATVPVIYRIGERLAGSQAAWVAAMLAATSPFNIYHSQEVRFYSLFIFAAAAFMLATVAYVDSGTSRRNRFLVIVTGLFLLISHFLGVIAVSAQGLATFIALKKRPTARVIALSIGFFALIFGLPLLPPVRAFLLHLYVVYGNAAAPPAFTTPVSLVSLAKAGFAGYAFLFGYHVYPSRLGLVGVGLGLSCFLLVRGVVQLWRKGKWTALALSYAGALVGVYLVLDSIGGRVAGGVSPRHVAFVWPVLIVLVSIGVSSFSKKIFRVLLIALLAMNAIALAYGWRKDWSYGPATDYRAAAEFASRWKTQNAAILCAGRAGGPVDFYFPRDVARISWYSDLLNQEPGTLFQYERLIVVSNDWGPDHRREMSQLLKYLNENYRLVDGRVDYPLFEYVFDRAPRAENPESATLGSTRQLHVPLSVYGLEFQDLKLPVTVAAKGATLRVNGGTELPNINGEKQVDSPLPTPFTAQQVVLVSTVTGESLPQGTQLADLIVERKDGSTMTFPIRLGIETNSWDQSCQPVKNCETVLQWNKRMALLGQNSYPGAWRDFSARMHAGSFNLPQPTDVARVSIRYVAGGGHLYIWGLALNSNWV